MRKAVGKFVGANLVFALHRKYHRGDSPVPPVLRGTNRPVLGIFVGGRSVVR